MRFIYSDKYFADLGQHVFPTVKYRMLKEKLIADGVISDSDLLEPQAARDKDMLLVHEPEYLKKLREGTLSPMEIYVMELPFTKAVYESFVLAAGGTVLASRVALQNGGCFNLAGGFHHAFPDHGEGFCILNDVAIAVSRLIADGNISRALIVDCDLHQGNGTAAIFSGRRDVFTFSIHQENNFPFVKPPSDFDIGLMDGTEGAEYNDWLMRTLPGIFDEFSPEFVIYLAGADPYEGDQLGMLRLSKDDLKERDRIVMTMARERNIPLCGVLAGGYAWRVEDTVEVHYNTVVMAKQIFDSSNG
jgi:acetoin utilization deacetylase AcuC-like enzyme